jgi:hypothetical protein
MKKFFQFMAFTAVVAGLVAVQSCDNEEPLGEAPVIVLDQAAAQNIPGGRVTFRATVTAPNGGQTLTVFVAGVEAQSFDMAGAKEFVQAFEYTIPTTAVVGSTIAITFQARDNANLSSAIANARVTVGDPVVVLGPGDLTTQTLRRGVPYLIRGQAFVREGVVLTVEAGAVIRGDKASRGTLIIAPGGRLVANGTAEQPIVFTSAQGPGERDRGDWGGIVWLGNAWVNQTTLPAIEGIDPPVRYGNITSPTTNADHNGGSLTFARIEYAGIELTPNNETNSLTMGSVGTGTTIERVMLSFGGDDGFEWFGGTVNGRWLVSHSMWDDDFDADFGWSGNVQFGLVVRNPFFADQSGSNAFECDNQGNANATPFCDDAGVTTGCTRGVFSNITVLGPRNIQAQALSGNYQNAIHIRRRTAVSIFNSFISGFRIGVRVDDAPTLAHLTNDVARHAHNVLLVPGTVEVGMAATATDASFLTSLAGGNATAIRDYWTGNQNTVTNGITAVANYTDLGQPDVYWAGRTAANFPTNPNFALSAGIAGPRNLTSGAFFTDRRLPASFFQTVPHRGGFGATDWTDGWCEFQPLNRVY